MDDAEPMLVDAPARSGRTPWHLWVVGIVSLLWNAIGPLDYTMSMLHNRPYIAAATKGMGVTADEMIAYIDSFPAWSNAFWALGVWGAIVGSVLLLMRSRYAVWAFGVSLLGLAVTTAYHASAAKPDWADQGLALTLGIWSIATFLLIYAVSMKNKGVLK